MFAGAYAALRLASLLRQRAGLHAPQVLAWAVPLIVATVVLMAIAISARLGGPETSGPTTTTLHRAGASLGAALSEIVLEMVATDSGGIDAGSVVAGLTIKVLFFFGVRFSWRRICPDPQRQPELLLFAAAVLLSSFAMIAAAYYQYGNICCSRHGALRQSWFILALAALAVWSAPRREAGTTGRLGPVLLLLAAGLPFAARVPGLMNDYRLWPAAVQARAQTWESGLAPAASMVFYPPPEGQVVHGAALPAGRYTLTAKPDWWAAGVLQFFHKQEVDIRSPE